MIVRRWPDYLAPPRELPDGRVLDVLPQLFGQAKLAVSADADTVYMDDAWEYPSPAEPTRAQREWDGVGEPTGWTRHPRTGRRRPDGDPEREYVRP